jgi:hypothetical protein
MRVYGTFDARDGFKKDGQKVRENVNFTDQKKTTSGTLHL